MLEITHTFYTLRICPESVPIRIRSEFMDWPSWFGCQCSWHNSTMVCACVPVINSIPSLRLAPALIHRLRYHCQQLHSHSTHKGTDRNVCLGMATCLTAPHALSYYTYLNANRLYTRHAECTHIPGGSNRFDLCVRVRCIRQSDLEGELLCAPGRFERLNPQAVFGQPALRPTRNWIHCTGAPSPLPLCLAVPCTCIVNIHTCVGHSQM